MKESPEYVRISTAAAIALGLKKGRFYRNATTYCINLLETYKDGCKANCQYCGQARDFTSKGECERLIRVGWPVFHLDEIISSAKSREKNFQRVCIAMVSHPRAGDDIITIIEKLKEDIRLSISALVTPTNLTNRHLEQLHEMQIDNITIALDTATKSLFERLRGKSVKSPHRYKQYLAGIEKSLEVFGKGKVGAHLIVGLGETELEMVKTIERLHRLGVGIHLFSFYPEQGSALEKMSPPSIGHYRRIQLARHLIVNQNLDIKCMKFNDSGQIVDFGLFKTELQKHIDFGVPFETSFWCSI
ncbi:MAG: radical SAM protein [Candidatus Hodarchaeales archaeon]